MKATEQYLDLIKSFPLRPIRAEADLRRAEAVMHELVDAGHLSAAEQDYLLILGNLIEEYEAKAHPILPLPAEAMLRASMEAKGVNQTELSKATGIPISTISDLLAKKRDFNVALIQKLAEYFHVGPAAFFAVR